MLKIRFIMIYNVNVFTMYESLLKNVLKALPIIYQNQGDSIKFQGNVISSRFNYKDR